MSQSKGDSNEGHTTEVFELISASIDAMCASMQRFFNTAGPCRPDMHDMIPACGAGKVLIALISDGAPGLWEKPSLRQKK